MARFSVIYKGIKQFVVVDTSKPKKNQPKRTYMLNGEIMGTYLSLEEAQEKVKLLNKQFFVVKKNR